MRCHFCEQEKEEGLPFRCNYCGETFCGEHRLPENHACPKVGGPLQPGYAKLAQPRPPMLGNNENRNSATVRSGRARFRLRYSGLFSEAEKKHILAATAIMTIVGLTLSVNGFSLISGGASPLVIFVAVLAFVISFVGHELAHKFLAQRNGLWAEFRTNPYGLMMTLVSIAFPFKILAPGQTNIQGTGRKEILGTIALIGPGFNIALGFLFYILSRFSTAPLDWALLEIVRFNAWLAIFNLIPFGSLDGTKVFEWDKMRWAIALAASVLLLILSYYPALIWR